MVDAYAAVFGQTTEVNDQHGHYNEDIDALAFNMTIGRARTNKFRDVGVFYNHGKTIYDTPSERHSTPLGHPAAIRSDSRGLLTSTHYGANGEWILQGIKDGDIHGHSFTGRIFKSDPDRVPRVRRGGELPHVRRLEMGLSEYGPTPLPYYEDALVVAVRSELITGQSSGDGSAGTHPPIADGGTGTETPGHTPVGRQSDLVRRIRRARLSRGWNDGDSQ
jgi:phage head maturation protease